VSPLSTTSVSIVLPVRQQADHIAETLRQLHASAVQLTSRLEMIAVVNGSTDLSAQICRDMAEQCPGLRVLELSVAGWGAAVLAGLAASTGEVVCYTNAARTTALDLRNAIALGLLNEGYAVKAQRRARDNLHRRIGSVIYNFEARALFGLASWDLNGTPKVFPRSFGALFELREQGDLVDLEWLVACSRHGYPLIELPIISTRRHGGRSTTGWVSAMRMYVGALALRRRLNAGPDAGAR